MHSINDKATELLKLHTNGRLLVLPNVWDPIGARVLEAKGYPAVATASAAISASLGYADGERIRRATMIDAIGRIAHSVEVPVTADIEAGYADSLDELRETTRLVLDSGVVGVNLQDSRDEQHTLFPVVDQCRRIAAMREVATARGVHLVINARTDGFLSGSYASRKTETMDDAVERAKAYADAGADCIYPIGPGDEPTVRELRKRIAAPINILISPASPPLAKLQALGVNRVSFGPFVFRACLAKFTEIADALKEPESGYSSMAKMVPREEAARYLRDEAE